MRGEKERIEWDMDRGRKNGTKIALNVVATPVSSPDSEIVGIVNSFRKVSST